MSTYSSHGLSDNGKSFRFERRNSVVDFMIFLVSYEHENTNGFRCASTTTVARTHAHLSA